MFPVSPGRPSRQSVNRQRQCGSRRDERLVDAAVEIARAVVVSTYELYFADERDGSTRDGLKTRRVARAGRYDGPGLSHAGRTFGPVWTHKLDLEQRPPCTLRMDSFAKMMRAISGLLRVLSPLVVRCSLQNTCVDAARSELILPLLRLLRRHPGRRKIWRKS